MKAISSLDDLMNGAAVERFNKCLKEVLNNTRKKCSQKPEFRVLIVETRSSCFSPFFAWQSPDPFSKPSANQEKAIRPTKPINQHPQKRRKKQQ